VNVRPGWEAGRDTVEVFKNVADSVYSFFWIGTPDTSGIFVFSTPEAESMFVGGQILPSGFFLGEHRVFLRGVDGSQTISETDSLYFTARNEAPASTITYPNIFNPIIDLGPKLLLRAIGVDEDNVSLTHQPVGYLVNLLRLDTLVPPIPILQASPALLWLHGEWIYADGDSLEQIIDLATPAWYMLGVRAVDENGGTEPILTLGRNVFKFQAFPTGGYPDLTISEPSIGSIQFRETPEPKQRTSRPPWNCCSAGALPRKVMGA